MPTGDPVVDGMIGRTAYTDTDTGRVVGYVYAGGGSMTVHPVGFSHWPGKLDKPHKIFHPPEELRRKLYALVFCSAGKVDYNETLAPIKSVRYDRWSGERVPEYAAAKIQEVKTELLDPSIGPGRIEARNVMGMAIDARRPLETPEAVARVGTVTLDFLVTEGTTGRDFSSGAHHYLLAYLGRPAVEFLGRSGERIGSAQMGEGDAIRMPAGVQFRFVKAVVPGHAALLWMRRSVAGEPMSGVPAGRAGGFPLQKVVNA